MDKWFGPEAKLYGLHTFDWMVLAVYLIGVTAIGVWSYKKVQNMTDFLIGGRRFGKVFMMFFAFGSGTSSEQAVSVVAGTWRAGLAGIWWQFLWLWATPFYWIVAPVMRRMRAHTTSDFFEARYGPAAATLYSVFGMIISIVFIAGGLFGSGKMVNALTGGQLDTVSDRLNISVPDLKVYKNTEPNQKWYQRLQIGRGVLTELSTDFEDQFQSGALPDSIRKELAKAGAKLSDQATVSTVEAGQRWLVTDNKRGHTFPVTKKLITTDGKSQTVLSVSGSGRRLVRGYELAILVMTVMFVLYGMAGGLGAAIVTDLVQGILTITFSFLLLPFVLAKIAGGIGHLHDHAEVKQGMFDLVASKEVAEIVGREPITIFYVFMLSLTALCGIVVQPHIMGVCGAGKTEFEGRFGFTFGNFIKRFCTIAWTFTGLACIVWYLGQNSPLATQDRETYQALLQHNATVQHKQEIFKQSSELSKEELLQVVTQLEPDYTTLPKEQLRELISTNSPQIRNDLKEQVEAVNSSLKNGLLKSDEFKKLKQTLDEIKSNQTSDETVDLFSGDPRKLSKEQLNQIVQSKLQTHFKSLPTDSQDSLARIDKDFADGLFGRAAYDILPQIAPGLLGLLLASLLAAIMSSSDAQMVVSSGLFTENIYKRFMVKNKSQRHYLWVGRLSGLVIVLFALVLQASFTDVIDALKVIIKVPAILGISLWIGIVWRGWTPLAVWATAISTAAMWWAVAYLPETIAQFGDGGVSVTGGLPQMMRDAPFSLHFMMSADLTKVTDAWQMASFLSVGLVIGFLVSLVTPRTDVLKLNHFFRLLRTPVRPGEVIESPCTLPDNPLPEVEKIFNYRDIELPKPSFIGVFGFLMAWVLVFLIVVFTYWLATAL